MIFRTLEANERSALTKALRSNYDEDKALIMDRRDTSFIGTSTSDETTDEEVINAIKSIPSHY